MRKREFNLENAPISIATLYSLPINFIAHTEDLAKDTFHFGFLNQLTYYDASFLSLAKHLDCPLITDNTKHQGKSRDIEVISLKDYSSQSK